MMVPKKKPDDSTYSGRFAIRLYELRKKAGLSAEQVAEELGVGGNTVLHWEANRRMPPVDTYPILAEIFKLKKVKDLLPEK